MDFSKTVVKLKFSAMKLKIFYKYEILTKKKYYIIILESFLYFFAHFHVFMIVSRAIYERWLLQWIPISVNKFSGQENFLIDNYKYRSEWRKSLSTENDSFTFQMIFSGYNLKGSIIFSCIRNSCSFRSIGKKVSFISICTRWGPLLHKFLLQPQPRLPNSPEIAQISKIET